MRRILYISVAVVVSTLPLTMNAVHPQTLYASSSVGAQSATLQMVKDSPPDTTPYARALVPEDFAPGGVNTLTPDLFVRDVVVSNTNANLTNTDTSNDGEPSIAINPSNTNEIVITAFSGNWNPNAPLWHSLDGGSTWTERFTIPPPPGVTTGNCPCDQAVDFGRANTTSGTFLVSDIFSGTTTNPANAASWNWFLSSGNAVRTNSVGPGNVDQPWLLVNRDTATASQDNVYVAYDDFGGAPDMRVAVALGTNPPNFVRDNQSGTSGGSGIINPGNRLAVDPRNGFVYDLFQQANGNGAGTVDSSGGSYNIKYFLNRSTDGGQTWSLNGNSGGIQVANADSKQGINPGATFSMGNCTSNNTYKFGTVNALLGGVDHAAVDPSNGDVYYVFGNRDSGTGNNRLSIIRLTDNGSGGLNVGSPTFVTGQVQAALPSVAVTSNGVVGVLYTQFDGVSGGGTPMFSTHLALSEDQAATFSDFVLESFLSSANDSGACRQRVLGDYQQVKAVGNTFYGVFTGNGAPFGRPFSNHDPIFFKVQAVCTITCPASISQSNDPNQCGAVVNYPSPTAVSCGTVTCSPASGSFFPVGTTTVTCTTEQPQSCSFTVTVNDMQPPTITCPADINAAAMASCPIATSAPVTFNVTASDNCPGVTVVCKDQNGQVVVSGQPFPTGTTTVTCTATDTTGNTATCGFNINVFSFCLQDDSNPGNVVLVNAQTGDFAFCCGGVPIASGRGTLTTRACIGTIDQIKADRQIHIQWDTAANNSLGAGTAFVQKSTSGKIVCQITDKNMSNNTCQCSNGPSAAPTKPPKMRTY